mgnify:CR=1 FL=1|jgi:hypothetical protein
MATTQAEIDDLKAKIEGYEVILAQAIEAGNEDDKKMFVNLITERGKTLNALLQQQQGKVNIPHHACPFNICCFP